VLTLVDEWTDVRVVAVQLLVEPSINEPSFQDYLNGTIVVQLFIIFWFDLFLSYHHFSLMALYGTVVFRFFNDDED
jgi:hypothetical protein